MMTPSERQLMSRKSRAAASSASAVPRTSSGPGTSSGKSSTEIGAETMAKPMPPIPCVSAAPKTMAAIPAKCPETMPDGRMADRSGSTAGQPFRYTVLMRV